MQGAPEKLNDVVSSIWPVETALIRSEQLPIIRREAPVLPQWFVMRAYKSEAKAEELLEKTKSLSYFIPKHYVMRVYHGIKSRRLVPVIPSLVFVHGTREQIVDFKKSYNFLQFIMRDKIGESDAGARTKEYLIVPDKQMDDFIRVASHCKENITYYKPEELNIEAGTRVLIHGGNFDGVTGIYQRPAGKRSKRLIVILEGILAVSAEVEPEYVEILK